MLKTIKLQNFRNFKKKDVSFSNKITVIVGPNASGKTNILESIFLLSTGKSFRARIEEEMISYNTDLSRVIGKVSNSNLEVVLTPGEIEVGDDRYEKSPRKKLLVNGVSRRLIDFAGSLKVTLFGPWDMDLVTESPSLRRKFLDTVLSQVDKEYRRATLSYERGLRQRNRLLLRIREENLSRSQLLFWDKLLIRNGDYISQKREEFIAFANSTPGINDQIFDLEYDKSAISEGRLDLYAQEEIAAATTLVGPHRDDFIFKIKDKKLRNSGRDLARFGSRGEQRMAILWLKLSELDFIENKSGEKPTLLLDDILSELDHEHREVVMDIIKGPEKTQKAFGQVIITTADPHYVENIKKVEKITLF
ncbi:MAG TPA: DNA replication and repair protein RecF [Patescibacteria group bacterium]|nr:DNA replication and repair protein RecF [Patescibacteria group bacterium]